MKKVFFLVVMMLTAAIGWSAPVDEMTAQSTAQQFLQRQVATGRYMASATGALNLSQTVKSTANVPLYYVFNSGNAFVIVSADDRAEPILGYGDGTITDLSQLPSNLRYWLECYKRQMDFLVAHPDVKVTTSASRIPLRAGTTVTPLISANWSQNAPYWNECPAFGTDTCYTGCPATSLAMVFHYWKYPKQQTPAVPSYLMPSYGVTLPELPPTVFDWDNMLDNYVGGDYTPEQATAVAHLMRYIGQVEEMDYTISGSGAYLNDIQRAVKFFEYDQNAQMLFKSDELGYENYSDTQWGNYIQTELTAGRPIVYCAYDNTTGAGHAFNVDGYDATDGTYHINWGWNGRGNGYFVLNAFSYSDYTFGTAQQMVIGIQPPAGYQAPRLQAYPTTVDMLAYIGKPSTTAISFKGTNLEGDVTLTLNDPDGVFSLAATTIAAEAAEGGTDIVVTYAPRAVSYGSWGDQSELTISTSLASEEILFPFYYAPVTVVLDCAEGDCISFKAGYYPMIQKIEIYAGDATATLRASESGDQNYRLIEGIAPSARAYTVRDLASGGSFFYQVKAHYIDGTESPWSETALVTLVEGGHDYALGDVNHDGMVAVSDVTALIDYMLSGTGDICLDCADVNEDGNVTVVDVTTLIDMLLGA